MKLKVGPWSLRALSLAVCLAAGCATQPGTPAARTAAEEDRADGGLPVPPPPQKKGIIVPSDVNVGTQPPGAPAAGTNNTGMGSGIGAPSN